MESHLLTIKDLVIEADVGGTWQPIVKGLSLSLAQGEVVGLIGESGAGKSTLGLAALGYTKPGCRIRSGSIVLGGQELVDLPESELRKLRGVQVSYVAQSAAAAFNPAHSLMDQFTEAPIQHGRLKKPEAQERGRQLFRQLQLPDPDHIGQRYPHQVSGGQLQRMMTAMAMGCQPEIVGFDEPTTALDVTTQIEVLSAIKEAVRARASAAIYITHDLAVVAQVSDRIMVLRDGDLVEEGNTRALLADPREHYTRRLLSVRSSRNKRMVGEEVDLVLNVEGVTARYPGTQFDVLSNIDVQVERGRTVAVVGESGSGKSTLARVITGLLPPIQGRVSFAGRQLSASLSKRNKDDLQRIQMIYQMPDVALNPRQRVSEIIGRPLQFYLNLKGQALKARIGELLEQIELPTEYMDRFPEQLSGGEKQRVCIARALAAEPDLIICDEVTSALDQLVAEDILQLLEQLQSNLAVSYLFITHDLATVKAIADHVVVMHEGVIVEKGPKADILSPPHAPYTELLLSSVPEMDPDWLDTLMARRRADSASKAARPRDE